MSRKSELFATKFRKSVYPELRVFCEVQAKEIARGRRSFHEAAAEVHREAMARGGSLLSARRADLRDALYACLLDAAEKKYGLKPPYPWEPDPERTVH